MKLGNIKNFFDLQELLKNGYEINEDYVPPHTTFYTSQPTGKRIMLQKKCGA